MEPVDLTLKSLEGEFKTPLLKASASYDEGVEKPDFLNTLSHAMENLKDMHNESAKLIEEYAAGGDVDTSEVMIAMEKTSVATNLAIKVRNKVVDSYEQIIRMQI